MADLDAELLANMEKLSDDLTELVSVLGELKQSLLDLQSALEQFGEP